MEELQSTEILDREILEDARRKAQRILKTADEAARAKAAEWDKKAAAVLEELREKYEGQKRFAAIEIMARLPLDKYHARAEKIEGLLASAMESWYAGLERNKVLAILQAGLSRRLALGDFTNDTGGQPRALIHKLERDEAASILRAALPGRQCAIEQTETASPYPEIILENDDVRITSSIYKTVDFLLHEKRAELAESLLGKAVLYGEAALLDGAALPGRAGLPEDAASGENSAGGAA